MSATEAATAARRLGYYLALVWGWTRLVLVLPWCVAMAAWDVRRHRPPANDDARVP